MMSRQQPRADASVDRSAPPPTLPHDEAVSPDGRAPVTGALFDLQLTFNLFPATYAHPSWIERLGLSAPGKSDIALSPFWVRRLSQALLLARGLHDHFDFDFSDRAKRLALLDATTLLRISGLVAAVLVRDRVRRVVQAGEVEAMRRAMGAQAHRLALSWDRAVPQLSRYVCDVTGPWPDVEAWMLRSMILAASAIPKTASGILGRLQLRFPQRWAQSRYSRLRLSEEERAALCELFFCILDEEGREYEWLFAPTESDREATC